MDRPDGETHVRRRVLRRVNALGPVRRRSPMLFVAVGSRLPRAFVDRAAGPGEPGRTAEEFVGRRLVVACGWSLAALIMSGADVRGLATAAIAGAAGWRLPALRTERAAAARRAAVLSSLPDILDLLAACAKAGASIRRSFELAAEHDRGPLGDAMRKAVRALDHGEPAAAAYANLAATTAVPEVATVAATLRRCERLGTSVAQTLTTLAEDMRARRRLAGEEQARRLPVRVLFPVVLCFLPAFVLLTIAPVLIVALRGFRGT